MIISMIKMYVDGSSRNNGKQNSTGGYGIVVVKDNVIINYYSEYFKNVTNNQIELKAILKAFELSQTQYKGKQYTIYSDSAYCVNICNKWIFFLG